MKYLKSLFLVLTGLAFFTSCKKDEIIQPSTPDNEGAEYVVSLNIGGEFDVEASEGPMTRLTDAALTPKNYYGVNVYCMKTDGTEYSYSHYAYGLFDNVNDMKITLLEGYKYRFECTAVKEVGNFYLYADSYINQPFFVNSSSISVNSLNKFYTSSSSYFTSIKYGRTKVVSYDVEGYARTYDTQYPPLDRFYGELKDFVPTDNGVATIHLKRTAFGLNLVINGVPDGSLSWRCTELECLNSSYSGTEPTEISNIITFYSVYDCWNKADSDIYTKDFTFSFVWTRANGYQQNFSKTFTAKRNVRTTLTVNLTGGANNITFGLQEDDSEMGSESDSIDYNGGALTDSEVAPTE